MPRLVLLEDDGGEIVSGEIPSEMVRWLEQLMQMHGGSMRTVAAALRIGRVLLGSSPPPPPGRRVAVMRPEYTPPRRKKRGHA